MVCHELAKAVVVELVDDLAVSLILLVDGFHEALQLFDESICKGGLNEHVVDSNAYLATIHESYVCTLIRGIF